MQYSGRTKKGNKYLQRVLTQSGWTNSHRKDGYLRAVFFRIKAKARAKKAVIAEQEKAEVEGGGTGERRERRDAEEAGSGEVDATDSVVSGVGDIDVGLVIEGDVVGGVELRGSGESAVAGVAREAGSGEG